MAEQSGPVRVLVLGASGRLGGMLRRHWGAVLAPVWQVRRPMAGPDEMRFDPLTERAALGRVDVVLSVAGAVAGDAAALLAHTDLALAALRLGADHGARRVFLSSSAAVYGLGGAGLAEDDPLWPVTPYAMAKRAMEEAALDRSRVSGVPVTVLRIGNVAGADALLGRSGAGPVVLDRFADGQGPRRSYIGPRAFADVMAGLVRAAAAGLDVPECLNIALPGAVAMADLLQAAGVGFAWRPAPDSALPLVELDVTRLMRMMPLDPARAEGIVADWRRSVAV